MAHFEIEPKLYQIRIYGSHPDNYLSSFQIYVEGDRGFMYSLNGAGFYENARDLIPEMMSRVGIKSVEAHVMPAHARLLRSALRRAFEVEIGSEIEKRGRKFCWIRLSRLQET